MRRGRLSLVTDLADRPMNSSALRFDCVPFSWHLSAAALAQKNCVAVCLSEALGQTQEEIEKGLAKVARGQDGFTRADVFKFLQAESDRTGVQIGWKALVDGRMVASQKSDPRAPFVGFSQWAGHMYLYSRDTPALNNCPAHTGKSVRAGVRQYTRALQSIPAEMRSRFLPVPSVGLALWELKKQKKNTKARNART